MSAAHAPAGARRGQRLGRQRRLPAPLGDDEDPGAEELAVVSRLPGSVAGPDVPAVRALGQPVRISRVLPRRLKRELGSDRPGAQHLVAAEEELHVVVVGAVDRGPAEQRGPLHLLPLRGALERPGKRGRAGVADVPGCVGGRQLVAVADAVLQLHVGEGGLVALVDGGGVAARAGRALDRDVGDAGRCGPVQRRRAVAARDRDVAELRAACCRT